MYGIMYGVKRTTVYFPDEMKLAIEGDAARRGVTEAEVIRSAVGQYLADLPARDEITPAIPEGLGRNVAGRVEEHLGQLGSALAAEPDGR